MKTCFAGLLVLCLLAACDAPAPPRESQASADGTGVWTPLGLQVGEVPRAALEALGLSHGVMVTRVRAPANRSAILPGDVIVRVDQVEVRSPEEFSKVLGEHSGRTIGLFVRRLDGDVYVALEPGERPAEPPARGTPLRT
jgi:serine protease Do